MVKEWEISRDKGIKITKMRIKHMEKHGMGDSAMQEKNILKLQLRHKELMDAKK